MRFFDVTGTLKKAYRAVNGGLLLKESELDDKGRLVSVIRDIAKRVGNLEAVTAPPSQAPSEFEVNMPGDGSTVSLAHQYGCPVRYYVTSWKNISSKSDPRPAYGNSSLVDRDMALTSTWANSAASNTVGTRWRINTKCDVIGVRFLNYMAGSRTIRCTLWNDSTGAILGQADIAVTGVGVYCCRFATPVSQDLTGVDVIASVWDTSGAFYCYSTDTSLTASMPMNMGPDLTLKSYILFSAGNAKPATNTVGGHFMVEPWLDPSDGPDIVFDASSDTNTLVLRSYRAGSAVVRVEPSHAAVTK